MGKQNQKKQLDRSNRPDFSVYLSHFTKDGDFCHAEQEVDVEAFRRMTAFERLCSILSMKRLRQASCRGQILLGFALRNARGVAFWFIRRITPHMVSDLLKNSFTGMVVPRFRMSGSSC